MVYTWLDPFYFKMATPCLWRILPTLSLSIFLKANLAWRLKQVGHCHVYIQYTLLWGIFISTIRTLMYWDVRPSNYMCQSVTLICFRISSLAWQPTWLLPVIHAIRLLVLGFVSLLFNCLAPIYTTYFIRCRSMRFGSVCFAFSASRWHWSRSSSVWIIFAKVSKYIVTGGQGLCTSETRIFIAHLSDTDISQSDGTLPFSW